MADESPAIEELRSIEERAANLLRSATQLRNESAGTVPSDPTTMLARLRQVRGALDSMEGLLIELYFVRRLAASRATNAKADLEDAWNAQATSPTLGLTHPDSAPRERYALYSSKTVAEVLLARRCENTLLGVDTAVKAVEAMHRGLRDTRSDINDAVRLISVESRLES